MNRTYEVKCSSPGKTSITESLSLKEAEKVFDAQVKAKKWVLIQMTNAGYPVARWCSEDYV